MFLASHPDINPQEGTQSAPILQTREVALWQSQASDSRACTLPLRLPKCPLPHRTFCRDGALLFCSVQPSSHQPQVAF